MEFLADIAVYKSILANFGGSTVKHYFTKIFYSLFMQPYFYESTEVKKLAEAEVQF